MPAQAHQAPPLAQQEDIKNNICGILMIEAFDFNKAGEDIAAASIAATTSPKKTAMQVRAEVLQRKQQNQQQQREQQQQQRRTTEKTSAASRTAAAGRPAEFREHPHLRLTTPVTTYDHDINTNDPNKRRTATRRAYI